MRIPAQQKNNFKRILLLTPFWGTLLFVILYFISTFLYPGGSQADKNSQGFSWMNNYWCNLLNEKAINGQHNYARPIAMIGLFILCASLSFFWFIFSKYVHAGKVIQLTIRVCGPLSMIIAFFLLIDIDHDTITNFASLFGIIAALATLVGLYKIRWLTLFAFGVFNILLVAINNYVYYSKGMTLYLPIIQKISFLSFLVWFCWIDINLYRMKKQSSLFIE